MTDAISQFLKNKRGRVDEYREKVEAMLADPTRYRFASDTLLGIFDHIEEHDSITDRQMEAVDNIYNSV